MYSLCYAVLVRISPGYPPVAGWFHTRYSPVRRSPPIEASFNRAAPRLACVRPVASVHPEPGSNSSLYYFIFLIFYSIEDFFYHPPSCKGVARDSPVLTLTFYSSRTTLSIISSRFYSLPSPGLSSRSIGKAGAKIEAFLFPSKYFCYFFSSFFCAFFLLPYSQCLRRNFFSYKMAVLQDKDCKYTSLCLSPQFFSSVS